jgi:hypothetical protein
VKKEVILTENVAQKPNPEVEPVECRGVASVCIVGTAAAMEALLLFWCSVVPRPSFFASGFCADFSAVRSSCTTHGGEIDE